MLQKGEINIWRETKSENWEKISQNVRNWKVMADLGIHSIIFAKLRSEMFQPKS